MLLEIQGQLVYLDRRLVCRFIGHNLAYERFTYFLLLTRNFGWLLRVESEGGMYVAVGAL